MFSQKRLKFIFIFFIILLAFILFDIFQLQTAEFQSTSEIIDQQKTVVEGYWATACFYEKSRQAGATAPVLEQVHRILYEGSDPKSAVIELMSRGLKAEGSTT